MITATEARSLLVDVKKIKQEAIARQIDQIHRKLVPKLLQEVGAQITKEILNNTSNNVTYFLPTLSGFDNNLYTEVAKDLQKELKNLGFTVAYYDCTDDYPNKFLSIRF